MAGMEASSIIQGLCDVRIVAMTKFDGILKASLSITNRLKSFCGVTLRCICHLLNNTKDVQKSSCASVVFILVMHGHCAWAEQH